ncbi:MAG: AraC family transcriptional regulator [Gammaproteobacteria bacterium]|nr:AraC family transcriptional regulator [Gammaproteobacteria bacterium]
MKPNSPIDPKLMVASHKFYDFFATLVSRDPDGVSLPLRIGATMRSNEYGAFGLAWKSAPTLRDSYHRAARYGRILGTAETYSLQKSEVGWFFNLEKAGDGSLGMSLSNEASMSAVNMISKEVSTSNFIPLAVFFKHHSRGEVSVFESHFGCPVYFDSGRDALLVSEEHLAATNALGDKTIAQFFDAHLENELAAVSNDEALEKMVRATVANSLSDGVPTLSFIASQLGLGSRTLQRRLTESGHSFQRVVDMARKDLAKRLLRETDYTLSEIAFLTGFSEQSGFNRAFKRWAGQTPRSYRLSSNTSKTFILT